ncbi:MAG TPA: DUF104 domain-containing protein [Anaerolineae bacterium]|nr:DUF104 domain-containing protein [Anaerolineae bacterium]
MPIVTRAVFAKGVLRPLEKLDLPENLDLLITIWPLEGDESGSKQETLADVLGFDPADEAVLIRSGEKHRRALLEMALSTTAASDPPHDGAVNHDKYLYDEPYR